MELLSLPCWIVLMLVPLLTFLFKIYVFRRKNLNFPSGPRAWPVIGNLNLIGPLPHQSLHQLSKRYGPLMQLKFGSFPVLIASSAEMAKQILKTNDHVFASRPKTAAGKYTTYDYLNITWAEYGPYWRQGRKIYLSKLFTAKRLESCECIRSEEMCAFMSRLYGLSSEPIVLKEQLSRVTLSIISRIVLGKKYFSECESDEDSVVTLDEFQGMLDELFLLNGVLNIGDWIPWLAFLDLQGYVKRMKDLKIKFDQFHDYVFNEHKAGRVGVTEFVAKDMVDVLLQLSDDPNLDVKLTYNSLKGFTQDLIAGGTDTSATTVEWAMSELMKQPHLIQKANNELDRVIGNGRWVEEKDFPSLPYIDAIMKETMRLHPVAVLLAPHLALKDCKIGKFDVEKGTRVFINSWSMGRDPQIWENPLEFQPERFLGTKIDVKGQSFELLPFGSGRRMCPGYNLGIKMIKSSLSNLLHGFKWKLYGNMEPEDLSMDEVYGLATPRKFPLAVVSQPRLPIHLYSHSMSAHL